jgi:hypothetical protein
VVELLQNVPWPCPGVVWPIAASDSNSKNKRILDVWSANVPIHDPLSLFERLLTVQAQEVDWNTNMTISLRLKPFKVPNLCVIQLVKVLCVRSTRMSLVPLWTNCCARPTFPRVTELQNFATSDLLLSVRKPFPHSATHQAADQ